MKGYIINIEKETKENTDFRRVLYTAKHSQLVVMSLLPGEEIGKEIHTLDQFIRLEEGEGLAILNGIEHAIKADDSIVIPAGTEHNIINTSADAAMKLYTIYSPPEHEDGTIHKTKADAMAAHEHFDDKTTE
ncbi:cupin [Candidatus Azambacteria bacterium RIFCSPHIGHO2_02_FULL_52_12]|uniref:Cupin n=1 Tax=Candidatus Azambacteria bacterium RIFCSPLOWO2_01_FULL_46_25 TaxID=1797298 RepID=A0A1F5BTN6_9BACT|nr:MAG: cupin [Candidatus Azambacteria bacterium RIFCSPHIGHO2_02_FULL_52_12]OGD33981.1 MAG: cupin [Candidatus Azambacteria bacterium RIFCSPLOWO2_01_FULL_46_25]OGD37667.1 MAG: cupin [Candidatus Azambacteria bacterium RIFCSPHIGHO2_01_FULL_51_74]